MSLFGASARRVAARVAGEEQRYKYPRTFHLPWSPGATSDDKILKTTAQFEGKRVVVTEKMDGENCTIGQNYVHARSVDSANHPSRNWVKGFASTFQYDIPDGWRLCGENMYAKHSIYYEELPSYFLLFSIWNERNVCLSWRETVEYAKMLGVKTVPVLYEGSWDEEKIAALWDRDGNSEGYVVRSAGAFPFSKFVQNIAKFVRPGHVQTDAHWMQEQIVPNKIIKQASAQRVASRKQARVEPLNPEQAKKFRKEVLMLAKAAERASTYNDVEQIVPAVGKWRKAFEYYNAAIRKELEARVREGKHYHPTIKLTPEGATRPDPAWAQYYIDNAKPIWDLVYEVGSLPGIPEVIGRGGGAFEEPESIRARLIKTTKDREGMSQQEAERDVDSYLLRRPSWTREEAEENAVDRWREEGRKWASRVRRKARKTWDFYKDLAEWSQRSVGGGRDLTVVVPDEEVVSLEGFRVIFRGFAESPYQDKLPALKHGLKEYRKLAAKRVPILLKRQTPIFIEWTFEPTTSSDAGAYYLGGKIFVTPWTIGGGKGFVKTMAHEMGHHIFKTYLSGAAKKAWTAFIRGDYKELDLREALAIMQRVGARTVIDGELAEEDPILFLQMNTLIHDHRFKYMDLFGVESIQRHLNDGKDPMVAVPINPITGYAGKNPEEAFCEALGLFVAYGKKALLGPVWMMLRGVLPEVRTASKKAMIERVAQRKYAEMTGAASVALMKWLSKVTQRMGAARHVYVVGGAVRNFLIDKPVKDIDMVVDSLSLRGNRDAAWVAKEIARAIPTRTEIVTDALMVSKVFIQGEWDLDGHQMKDEVIEIVNARAEIYEQDEEGNYLGHKPVRVDPTTLEIDATRREFTFNTLMWSLLSLADGPEKAEIIDLTGCGIRDLEAREMRCPQDPDKTFTEDPTRIIRTIKFAFKYGFKLPPDVKAAATRQARGLKRIPSKAWGALRDIVLENPQYKKALKVMDDLGVVDVLAEMVRDDKQFATTLLNYSQKRGVAFMFDLMDLGIPVGSPMGFMDSTQQRRFRELAVGMERDEALHYLEAVKNPGVAYKDKKFVPSLAREHGVAPNKMRDFMPVVTQIGRGLLLDDPELLHDAPRLKRMVQRGLGSANVRAASEWLPTTRGGF